MSVDLKLWHVAVDAPLPGALTYSAANFPGLQAGQVVTVPLGKRTAQGLALAPVEKYESEFKIKEILEIHPEYPVFPPAFLKWISWLSSYYVHPIGLVMKSAIPPLTKESKRKSKKAAVIPDAEPAKRPELTDEQQRVIDGILSKPGFGAHLLFGVTGSGKTEVYIRLLEQVLSEGKQALVLVPEISLTPQLLRRFVNRLGQSVAVIHSHLTEREKTDQWWQMVDKKKQVLIGARSALFCPLENLGMIIVDEEHEPSFKQEEQLKYHARDSAIMLAKLSDCPIVLGSATPSLESYKNALDGKYHLHRMEKRVENRPMPNIEVVDLKSFGRKEKHERDSEERERVFWLSPPLEEKIRDRLAKREQVALFLNRRGMAQIVVCPACGETATCPNCSVSLTLHARHHLVCHYCNFQDKLTEECGNCKQGELRAVGMGTERVEDDLKSLFPNARITRADRDNIQSREALEEMIRQIENREVDILVGTQMIAKGLDFEGLTLVGMVLADIGFNLPDFRAAERSFQLLMQMGGRAGRHLDYPGEVVIQTYNPQHSSIQYAQTHDYIGFAEQELALRRELFYPPYGRLAAIRLQGTNQSAVINAANAIRNQALVMQKTYPALKTLDILGPAEAPLAKLRGNH
ncbi:MAG TPA: primosomal protein N', partial [Bdellovibrionales bacterium]|nr:primosomal protein N' [Bdellovibrionales bacterium]